MPLILPFLRGVSSHKIQVFVGVLLSKSNLLTQVGNKKVSTLTATTYSHDRCRKCLQFKKGEISVLNFPLLQFVKSMGGSNKDKILQRAQKFKSKTRKEEVVETKVIVKETDYVQLFSADDFLIGRKTYSDAKAYAKEEGFKLQRLKRQLGDSYPSFKLLTENMFKDNRAKEKELKKIDSPIIRINDKIEENDLSVKTKAIIKHLSSGSPVVVKVMKQSSSEKSKPLVDSIIKRLREELDHIAYIKSTQSSVQAISTEWFPRKKMENDDDE